MGGFFRKLNTLISSQINDTLRPLSTEEGGDAPRKRIARDQVRQGLSRDIAGLRQRIVDAQDYQDTLQRRIDRLYGDVQRWDTAADQAVADGRQLDARLALERLQAAQRDLARTEDDLRQHQEVTDELISKVNYMDYVVNQPDEQPEEAPVRRTPVPVQRETGADKTATTDNAPKVHVLGQAPQVAASQTEAPEIVAQPKEIAEPRRIKVQVEMEDAPTDTQPTADIPVQVVTTTPESITPEQEIRKRRSKYAKIGDAEYAEGVELAKDITQKLDVTREKLAQLVNENQPTPPEPDVLGEVKQEVDQSAVEDELSRRISRLSRPPAVVPPSDDVPLRD